MAVALRPPLSDGDVEALHVGDRVSISGVVYTARDAAHRRFIEALDRGEALPFDVLGQVIYYVGPSPARPGQVIGSAGPTTASRMDSYTPRLLAAGLKATIGKGGRSQEVRRALREHRAVYLGAVGGAGALLAKTVKKVEPVAYPDLGTEAVVRLEVEGFPAIVVNDIYGGDLYEAGRARYALRV